MWFDGPPFLMLEGVWPDYVYDDLNGTCLQSDTVSNISSNMTSNVLNDLDVTCLWSDTDIHDIDNNKVSNDPNLSEIINPSKYNSFLKLVRITIG